MNFRTVYYLLLSFSLLFFEAFVTAQETFIKPNDLLLTCNKTTHLIFPYAIRSIDRGSPDVLAQRAPGTDNVLQLKAAKAGFAETNITVITVDNKLYPFLVTYSALPEHLTISFIDNREDAARQQEGFSTMGMVSNHSQPNIDLLQHTAKLAAVKKKRMYSVHASHANMQLFLRGVYIQEDVLYFQFRIYNGSNIRFDPRYISFTIKDARKAKRRAVQEQIIRPLLLYGMDSSVQEHASRTWVAALPKLTLEDGKYLAIQVLEQGGGRHLSMHIVNRHLLGAKEL